MRQHQALSQRLTSFEAAFCSGLFAPSAELVTALALLFDKVHFAGELEYVIQLAQNYRLELDRPTLEGALEPAEEGAPEDPLASLTAAQRATANAYLGMAAEFFFHYRPLFPQVFSTAPVREVDHKPTIKLLRRGGPGELSTYQATFRLLTVSTERTLPDLLHSGYIPVVAGYFPATLTPAPGRVPSSIALAAALAIRSVAMVLPGMRGAHPEVILEARSRLSDLLPPFWSSMLKLTVELKQRSAGSGPASEQGEVDDLVATLVRPALIELVEKIEKERRLWFRRILAPVASGLRVLVGRPPTDLAGLLTSTLALSSDVALDAARQMRKVEALRQESGLTYLLEVDRVMARAISKKSPQRLKRDA